nr:hypothetical protein I308_00538 [Cryptococcus tetragattii IND107]
MFVQPSRRLASVLGRSPLVSFRSEHTLPALSCPPYTQRL